LELSDSVIKIIYDNQSSFIGYKMFYNFFFEYQNYFLDVVS